MGSSMWWRVSLSLQIGGLVKRDDAREGAWSYMFLGLVSWVSPWCVESCARYKMEINGRQAGRQAGIWKQFWHQWSSWCRVNLGIICCSHGMQITSSGSFPRLSRRRSWFPELSFLESELWVSWNLGWMLGADDSSPTIREKEYCRPHVYVAILPWSASGSSIVELLRDRFGVCEACSVILPSFDLLMKSSK